MISGVVGELSLCRNEMLSTPGGWANLYDGRTVDRSNSKILPRAK